jgi:menaquinone-dependent protoporphyrinogen oxidase
MNKKVLVSYASKYGSTAEIATQIGNTLTENGLETDVLEVKEVHDLGAYDAIVLGSAVYIGRWRKDAVRFVKMHEKALVEKRVWIFSTGPTGQGDPVKLLEGWKFPKKLERSADRIKPEDIAVFHGAVDPAKLSGIQRYMIRKTDVPTGDFRQWETITTWAKNIADELAEN